MEKGLVLMALFSIVLLLWGIVAMDEHKKEMIFGMAAVCLIITVSGVFIYFLETFYYPEKDVETIEGEIAKIEKTTIDGNSHYYIFIEDSDEAFDVSTKKAGIILGYDYDNEQTWTDALSLEVGDKVELEYIESGKSRKVLSIND